jgi:hypothetical protein
MILPPSSPKIDGEQGGDNGKNCGEFIDVPRSFSRISCQGRGRTDCARRAARLPSKGPPTLDEGTQIQMRWKSRLP